MSGIDRYADDNENGWYGAMQPVVDAMPMKWLGMVEEIADACVWLCSTRASFVQGQSLIVDGGIVLM